MCHSDFANFEDRLKITLWLSALEANGGTTWMIDAHRDESVSICGPNSCRHLWNSNRRFAVALPYLEDSVIARDTPNRVSYYHGEETPVICLRCDGGGIIRLRGSCDHYPSFAPLAS